MKLTVFQSDKGDCLLVTGNGGKWMLVDGGMRSSYAQHVAAAFGSSSSGSTAARKRRRRKRTSRI